MEVARTRLARYDEVPELQDRPVHRACLTNMSRPATVPDTRLFNLTQSVFNVVSQKLIPTQIRPLIHYYYKYKE